jgi:phosphohistidine phosphatase SixA
MAKWTLGALFALGLMTAPAWAAPLKPGLADQLRQGGYVLVMRHASSPPSPPDKSVADKENIGLERQLDEQGRKSAQAMGRSFKALHIPVGEVFSSPTYRALETVRLAAFGTAKTVVELGDQGHSMQALKGPGPAAWLKAKVAELPAAGRNTIIVTHMPNITAAFPQYAAGLHDGETLVFRPTRKGGADMIARVPIEDWGS